MDYPNIEVETYSPPYKLEFSSEENNAIISAINKADPDLLWIGMTAPKQENGYTYIGMNYKFIVIVERLGLFLIFMQEL